MLTLEHLKVDLETDMNAQVDEFGLAFGNYFPARNKRISLTESVNLSRRTKTAFSTSTNLTCSTSRLNYRTILDFESRTPSKIKAKAYL